MDFNLAGVLRHFPPSDADITLVMGQILQGVQWIHSSNIIHRDLTPENVLIHNGRVAICDFSMATENTTDMVHDVTTGWYRATEVLLVQPFGFASKYRA